eukprot:c5748_g1_i2.p1 GENE.c5748_g1_i2~~c5748_g1_i2.p1  ORF type:complete len:194 (+),score=34.58 c5748_g1_i2:34-582(+)
MAKRVLVFETTSRAILCDKVISWDKLTSPELNHHTIDGICRLAQSFGQLSRDLSAGPVSKISFDAPNVTRVTSHQHASSLFQLNVPRIYKPGEVGNSLFMTTADEGKVMVVLFYVTLKDEEAKALAQQILSTFLSRHSHTIQSLQPHFEAIATDRAEPADMQAIQTAFSGSEADLHHSLSSA